MTNFTIFLRKEITEIIRTKWLLVIACVFGGFSILSPLTARYVSEILSFTLDALGEDTFGLALPPPDFTQSYMQFYGDIGQMGVIALILLSMNVLLRELKSGTAFTMFMKGLAPGAFVLAKFTARAVALLLILLVAVSMVQFYTYLLFEQIFPFANLISSALLVWLYLLFILSFMLFAGALLKSTAIVALLAFGLWIIMLIIGAIPRIGQIMPVALSGVRPFEVLSGYHSEYLFWSILVAVILIAVLLVGCARIVKNKEM
ncbi:MAG: ABC transporter permease subunit [Turicibacter sp.]|nr:ABC transporter permease subunit [Turicibacter sp.]